MLTAELAAMPQAPPTARWRSGGKARINQGGD